MRPLEGVARVLHHRPELHARRPYALAVAAQEAELHLVREGLVRREAILGDRAHEVDPPARARGFLARQPEGGTGLEAQAAVDAVEALRVVDERRLARGQ